MWILFGIATAPIIIILAYLYYRDKYEKEPIKILLFAFFLGALSTIPIALFEQMLSDFGNSLGINKSHYADITWDAFIVASMVEESIKFIVVVLLIWFNKNFNELFDGIIYAVFVSLGFATIENIVYVVQGGLSVGILRVFTAVPGHTIFAIGMGFYLSLAKFNPERSSYFLCMALFVPWVLHGIYDFILLSANAVLLFLFIPYLIWMYKFGFYKLRVHSENSVFKTKKINENTKEL